MSNNGGQFNTNSGQKAKAGASGGSPGPGGIGPRGIGPGRRGHGPGGIGRPVEKPKDFKGTLKRLLVYLKPYKINLTIVLIFAIASTVFAVLSPKVQAAAINRLTDGYMARVMLRRVATAQRTVYGALLGADTDAEDIDAAEFRSMMGERDLFEADMGKLGITLPEGELSPEVITAIMEFVRLPLVDTVEDPAEKAEIIEKIMELAKELPVLQQFGQTKEQGDEQEDASGKEKDGANHGSTGQTETDTGEFTPEQIQSALQAIRETGGKTDFKYILRILIILASLYVLSSFFQFIMQWVMTAVAQRTSWQLRKEVNSKLTRLPLKYYDSKTHGEILSRVTNDVDSISNTLQQSITQVITASVQIIGYIIMMLVTSPALTLIVILTLPLYVIITTAIAKRSQKYFASQQKELGELSGHVEEMYAGHKIVKAFNQENESINEFEDINERLYKVGWKAQFISGSMFPLMNFISNIGYVLVCVFGGLWMTKGRLKLGDITAFIQYSRSFTQPIVQTANIANVIQSTIACAERVFEVLDEEEEIADSESAIVLERPQGKVDIENVYFSYKDGEPLITGMNLSLNRGDTIAIVGPTGAGKTTLVNLLMRFYEIQAGSIKIDDVDIRDIRRNALRSVFGMVLQDTWLFNGTIRDNISYGREGASLDDITAAAKAAYADHFIRTLPDGYDTILNEEATNISQGQKQLLTIARAILADPAVLILDEATSSVDTRTEVLIQEAMANLMKNRTSFVIAHRLSTIRDAELILVMNEGSIIEQGTHKGLLARNGFYADLYNSQFNGGNLGAADPITITP